MGESDVLLPQGTHNVSIRRDAIRRLTVGGDGTEVQIPYGEATLHLEKSIRTAAIGLSCKR